VVWCGVVFWEVTERGFGLLVMEVTGKGSDLHLDAGGGIGGGGLKMIEVGFRIQIGRREDRNKLG
jgi:hypothetical protein